MIKLVRTSSHTLDRIFIFGLFVLFCTTSCLLVFIGANQYRNISTLMWKNKELYTASAYLKEKLQEYDTSHSISFSELDGISSIVLSPSDESGVITYIYSYDGCLRELTQQEATEFSPDSGKSIATIEDLKIETFGRNLYCFTLTDSSGNPCSIYLSQNTD